MLRISSCTWWLASGLCWIMKLTWQYIWTKLEHRNHQPRLQACVFNVKISEQKDLLYQPAKLSALRIHPSYKVPNEGLQQQRPPRPCINICSESTGDHRLSSSQDRMKWSRKTQFLDFCLKNHCSYFQHHFLSFLQCKLVPFSDTSLSTSMFNFDD